MILRAGLLKSDMNTHGDILWWQRLAEHGRSGESTCLCQHVNAERSGLAKRTIAWWHPISRPVPNQSEHVTRWIRWYYIRTYQPSHWIEQWLPVSCHTPSLSSLAPSRSHSCKTRATLISGGGGGSWHTPTASWSVRDRLVTMAMR